MKRILLFGAGRSATCLIDYLVSNAARHDWEIVVADNNLQQALSKTGGAPRTRAVSLNADQPGDRKRLVREADVVISLLPPSLHYLVALDCLETGRNLLNASYVDEKIRGLAPEVEKKGLLFLCEMGLDPGMDHMSAMQLIHQRQREGTVITGFRSHTGGLVAPSSDDNPWHYKISWNPRNVVLAGSAGAAYKEENIFRNKTYAEIFEHCGEVSVDGLGTFAFYPNRDSLSYMPLYGQENTATFIRTTLRHPDFCKSWAAIVAAGLTNDKIKLRPDGLTFRKWSLPLVPYVNPENRLRFEFLGLFSDSPVPAGAETSADILQYLLETRLPMRQGDKDMIVMLHELDCTRQGRKFQIRSSLVVEGEDSLRTAMARTVGLPLGIATKLILSGSLTLKGIHIPIVPEIYEPVLEELKSAGISFREKVIS
jgi:saccharopine dehydrogenase-like NADP-dependent oxidoreductase